MESPSKENGTHILRWLPPAFGPPPAIWRDSSLAYNARVTVNMMPSWDPNCADKCLPRGFPTRLLRTVMGWDFRLGATARGSFFGTAAFYSHFVGYVETGQGAAILVNGKNSGELIQIVIHSIRKEYGWP